MDEEILYGIEFEYLNRAFPRSKFTICINPNILDDVISNKNIIAIKTEHKCYCYGMNGPTKFFYVNNNGNGITNRDVIKQLNKDNYDPDCNHNFLESIDKDNEAQFSLWFGS